MFPASLGMSKVVLYEENFFKEKTFLSQLNINYLFQVGVVVLKEVYKNIKHSLENSFFINFVIQLGPTS